MKEALTNISYLWLDAILKVKVDECRAGNSSPKYPKGKPSSYAEFGNL